MEKKLYRNTSDQAIAGVAAGLARYFEIDVTWIRIFFILATIFGASGLLIYIILWIAIPEQPFGVWNMPGQTDYKVKDTTANSFETLSVQSNGLVATSLSSILKTLLRIPPISDAITCLSFNSTHKLPTKPRTAPFSSTLLPSKSQSVFYSSTGLS
jgi:phage shock protein PspC (stress-responsive transcriptional regulator)